LYDAYGEEGLRGRGYAPDMDAFGSVSDLFSAFFGSGGLGDMFGGGGGGGRPGRPARGGPGGGVGGAAGVAPAPPAPGTAAGGARGGGGVGAAATDPADGPRAPQVGLSSGAAPLPPHCNGNGAGPATPIVTCRNCDGTGQIQRVASTAFGRLVRTAICDVCG